MCQVIRYKDGTDVGTIRQFEETFKVDSKIYGFDGNLDFIDCCMCSLDLEQFFKDNSQLNFEYESGDWWEI